MERLPIPDNFPIKWKNPGDEDKFWLPEIMHAPFPVTPLSEYTGAVLVSNAFADIFEAHAFPMKFELQIFNYYQYVTVTPKEIPPEKMEETIRIAEENSELSIVEFAEKWEKHWFPTLIALNAEIESVPYQEYSDDELGAHFKNVLDWAKKLWIIHAELAIPMLLAPSAFQELYAQLFSPENNLEVMELFEGVESETVKTGLKIWQLSKDAEAQPAIAEIFAKNTPDQILESCRQTEEGRKYVEKIEAFLKVYGKRNENFFELNSPTWIEDPTPLMAMIQSYLLYPEHDFKALHQKKKISRENRLADTRKKMAARPKAVQETFEMLLTAAQAAVKLQEDHNYLIDARVISVTRHVLTEIAKRMTRQGLIAQEGDIYFLYADEIVPVLCGKKNLQEKIDQRKKEFAHFCSIERPQALGTVCKVTMPDTIFNRAMGRFFGGLPEASGDKNILLGNAASPGKVRGKAIVARSVHEGTQLKKGDILVTRTTSPSWTPLFATAGAVVTER